MHVCQRERSSHPLRFYDVSVFEKQEDYFYTGRLFYIIDYRILTKHQLISHQCLLEGTCKLEL